MQPRLSLSEEMVVPLALFVAIGVLDWLTPMTDFPSPVERGWRNFTRNFAICRKSSQSVRSDQWTRRSEGLRIAVLATDGFEQSELTEPVKALRQSGAQVDVVSLRSGEIQGMQHKEKGDKVRVDRTLDEAKAGDYAGLAAGRRGQSGRIADRPAGVRFVRQFAKAKKPIAAISHGPWMLIDADAVRGKTVAS